MIEIVPATGERWPLVVELFGGHGTLGCWCQYWRRSAGDYARGGPGAGEANLERQVLEGDPPPGMLALLDGQAVGWLGFGPRPALERLVRSRTIPAIDDVAVWSVVCFLIRPGFRRRGVAKALLDGVIAFARERGAPGLEAYPIDPAGERVDVAFAYVGFTPMFERAGFRLILETGARSASRPRWLMRLDLDGG